MRTLRSGIAAFALLGAVATAACGGLTKSPTEGLTFKPPAGWTSSPGIMGMMQFWTSPDKKQVMLLFNVPSDFKMDEAFSSADVKDAHIETQRSMKICGNVDAQYVKAIATSSRTGDDTNLEMIQAKGSSGTLISMYVYPIGAKPDGDAEAALSELCPAKT
jgi:hypothetical protein